jgi:hypothetical protein
MKHTHTHTHTYIHTHIHAHTATIPCTCWTSFLGTDGDLLCLCPSRFKGPLCNDSKTDCEKQPCANSGVCVDTSESLLDGVFTCECADGFQGALCDVASAQPSSSSFMALGAFLGLLALSIVLVVVWIRRRNKARQRKDYHVFIRCVCVFV